MWICLGTHNCARGNTSAAFPERGHLGVHTHDMLMECLLVKDKIVKRLKFRNKFVFYGHSCIKQMYLGEFDQSQVQPISVACLVRQHKLCTLQSLECNNRHCLHIGFCSLQEYLFMCTRVNFS